MRFERYLVMEKEKKNPSAFDKVRKPTAPPTQHHGDKNKYDRKEKHKKKLEE